MTKMLHALVFVQQIAKTGKLYAQTYKTLAMGALQNPYVNLELKMIMGLIVPQSLLHMIVIFHVKH
jgi:hypothetical protein